MDNDPQPRPRNRHPLEEGPPPARPPQTPPPRQPVLTRPPAIKPQVTYILVGINVIIFAAGFLQPGLGQTLFQYGASRSFEVLVAGEYYRLFTAMFLHASLMHIFFNAYALYVIGASLEPMFGHRRFAIVYLLGGLGGSVLSVIMGNPNPLLGAPSVGASGAVFAIFGAEMVFLYRHRQLLGPRAMAQFRNLLFLLGINLALGIASGLDGSPVRIDNWAHLGGLAGGLVLTWMLGPILRMRPDPLQPYRTAIEDTRPLQKSLWMASLYALALVALLAVFTFLLR